MTRFDDYIERATELLRADPFVHRDVRRELEAHLEDAAEEARAGGAAEDEAQAHALRAFGDADTLAEQLYEANRTRMRLRWWGKWATRLVLVPAALVLAIIVGAYGLGIARRVADLASHHGPLFMAFVDSTAPRPRPGLTQEQKWLFEETTRAPWWRESARAVMERFPHDPVAYAYYIRNTLGSQVGDPAHPGPGWIEALERGRRIDPQNAIYDYLLAYTLLAQSTEVVDPKGITFEYRRKGWHAAPKPTKIELPTLEVTDAAVFRQAMEAARAGFRKPLCTGRDQEWDQRIQALFAEPTTYEELLAQWAYHAGALVPYLYPLRQLARWLPACALLLGSSGAHEEAVRMAQQMDRPGIQLGADAHFVIDMLVASDITVKTAGAAPQVLDELGDPQAAAPAEQSFQDELNAYAAAVPAGGDEKTLDKAVTQRAGIMAQQLVPALPGFRALPVLDATRLAEHVLAGRIVLAAVLALVSVLLLALAPASTWSAWRHPGRDDRPLMLFIGWRRLVFVLLVGLAVPLGLYALETRFAPWRSLRHGINIVLVQRVVELGIGAGLVVFLTGAAAYHAVRARCEEAGVPVPPSGHFNPLRRRASAAFSLLLALAFGACATGILAGADFVPGLGLVVVALVVAAVSFLPVFLFWQVAHLGYIVRPLVTILKGLLTAARRTPIWLVAIGAILLGGAGLFVYGIYALLSPSAVVLIFVLAFGLPVLAYALARTRFTAPVPAMLLFRRTFSRSMVPVLAACVLALGLFGDLYLGHAEAAAIEPLNASGFHWYDEMEVTDWQAYSDHLWHVNEQWLAQHGLTPDNGAPDTGAPPSPGAAND